MYQSPPSSKLVPRAPAAIQIVIPDALLRPPLDRFAAPVAAPDADLRTDPPALKTDTQGNLTIRWLQQRFENRTHLVLRRALKHVHTLAGTVKNPNDRQARDARQMRLGNW